MLAWNTCFIDMCSDDLCVHTTYRAMLLPTCMSSFSTPLSVSLSPLLFYLFTPFSCCPPHSSIVSVSNPPLLFLFPQSSYFPLSLISPGLTVVLAHCVWIVITLSYVIIVCHVCNVCSAVNCLMQKLAVVVAVGLPASRA